MADVEKVMREAFDLGKTSGEVATYPLIEQMVIDGHGPDEINAWVEQIDPNRLVWDHPAKPGETGARDWPLLEARYRICSDVYGHEINVPADAADNPGKYDTAAPVGAHRFAQACRQGYDDGTLHDRGVVAMDRRNGLMGFLVTVTLDDEDQAPTETLAHLGLAYGTVIEGMAYPSVHGKPGIAVVTAFLDETRLELAEGLSQAIHEATRPAAATPRP